MISDREMKLAAEELFQAMLASLPDECSCVYSFSEKFEEKMRKLIYATNHPKRRRILQRVATIILIFTFGFATLLALCPSVRASIFGWVKTQYDSFTKYYFDGSSDSNNDFSAYGLHYLPTGYTEIDRIDLENESSIYYLNEETNQLLYFICTNTADTMSHYILSDGYSMSHVSIKGVKGDLYMSNDPSKANSIIWSNEESSVFFIISAFCDQEELIKIAENIQ